MDENEKQEQILADQLALCQTPSPALARTQSQMSSSLRERLKRCSRYYVPSCTPKRPCHGLQSPVAANSTSNADSPAFNIHSPEQPSQPADSCVSKAINHTPLFGGNGSRKRSFLNMPDDEESEGVISPKEPCLSSPLCPKLLKQSTRSETRVVFCTPSSKKPVFSDVHGECLMSTPASNKGPLVHSTVASTTPLTHISAHGNEPSSSPSCRTSSSASTKFLPPNPASSKQHSVGLDVSESTELRKNTSVEKETVCMSAGKHSFGVGREIDTKKDSLADAAADHEVALLILAADQVDELKSLKQTLQQSIVQKEELLRKLNLVKLHRTKNDLETLSALTNKWLSVSRRALLELLEVAPEPKPTMAQMIHLLQLDPQMLRFDIVTESFS